ncbi:hypothetical protein BH24CHL8_BH24CHL8_05500 [soil metagenome]
MPTYEYVCGSCARRIDVLHGIHADGPTTCEVCGGTLRKAISAAAVVFKGSGWAKKDAARAAARPASEKGDSDGKPSERSPSDRSPSDESPAESERPKEGARTTSDDAGAGRSAAPVAEAGAPAKPAARDTERRGAKASSGRPDDKGPASSRPSD